MKNAELDPRVTFRRLLIGSIVFFALVCIAAYVSYLYFGVFIGAAILILGGHPLLLSPYNLNDRSKRLVSIAGWLLLGVILYNVEGGLATVTEDSEDINLYVPGFWAAIILYLLWDIYCLFRKKPAPSSSTPTAP